jgi:tetratricopeptide (TPR) repeat protein
MLDDTIASARSRGLRVALKIGLAYRNLVHYFQTDYPSAEAACVEGLAVATEMGDGFYALAARMFLGLARANLGRVSEALDDFTDAIAVARRNDDRYWLPRLVSHLGWVHRELGALHRAREHDNEAVRLARAQPVWGPESEALLNLCVDDVRQGHAERASELLAELQARAAASPWMRWVSELRLAAAAAEHWSVRGDHERTLEHAARLADVARSLGARGYRCAAFRMQAEVALARGGDVEPAARNLRAALAELRVTPAPLEVWKSARLIALLLRRLGDEDGARIAFAEAARAIGTIAAGTRDESLREGFLGLPQVSEVLAAPPPA